MSLNRVRKWAGFSTIAGSIGFVIIVIVLHLIQSGYDPKHQLMSELALGYYGWAMFFAFLCLGASILSILIGVIITQTSPPLIIVLGLAGACFIGAGIFPLGTSDEIHILLIACAFISIDLAMFIFPSSSGRFSSKTFRFASWTLAGAMAMCVALGTNLLPMGVAQRMAALFLIVWILMTGSKLVARGI